MNLNKFFQDFCKKNNLEINAYQLTIVNKIESFLFSKKRVILEDILKLTY